MRGPGDHVTKRMTEDLSDYMAESNLKVHYLHSEVVTLQRVEILRDLRLGKYDVVVRVNLLREGSTCRRSRW